MQEKLDLESELKLCKSCSLCKNGHYPPKWTEKSKYATLMTYPFKDEPSFMKKFWKMVEGMGISQDHFIQLNTINCMPDRKKRNNGLIKPSHLHRSECNKWLCKYLDLFEIKKMIAFGNIPMEECIGEFNGINDRTGTVVKTRIGDKIIPTVLCIHPKGIENSSNEKLIRQAIKKFREI